MSPRVTCTLLFVSLSFLAGSAEETWHQFRGPNGSGVIGERELPISWDRETNVSWRTELPGEGWSSPVVSGGKIYLSGAVAADADGVARDLVLFIVDADSGKMIAQKTVIQQTDAEAKKIHKKNTHASPTPIVEGNRIYVHFGFQGTACTDLEGNVVWTNRELTFPPVHGNGGSPVVVDDMIVFTCDGSKEPYVAALKKETGEVAWKTTRPVDAPKKFSFCTPTVIEVDGQKQVIAPGSDCVLALRPDTGEIIWQVDYVGYSVVPKPVFENGTLYVCSGFDRGGLLAIKPNGTGNITESHVYWQLDKGMPKTPSVIVSEGLLYLVSDAGVAMCLDAETGDKVWQERLGGNYSASPLKSGDRIYFTNEEGKTIVVRAGERFEELASNDLGERTLASMAVAGNSILLRTENALYKIEKK